MGDFEKMGNLKVLHVVSSYSGIKGGIEKVVSELNSELQCKGIRAQIFYCSGIKDCFSLFEKIISEKPDTVHLHGFRLASLFAWYAASVAKKPLIITPHFDIEGRDLKHRINFWLHKRIGFKKIIAVTEIEKKILIKMGFSEKTIKVIPHGINLREFESAKEGKNFRKKFSIRKKDFLVLFVGRIAANKGIPILIEAFSLLKCKNKKLAIVGKEDKRFSDTTHDYLKKLIKKFSLDGLVLLAGELPRKEVINAFNACDVFVLPSFQSEAFGLVLAEAMAAKKPVVATNVGGIPEVVDKGKNGFLVEPNNSQQIHSALKKLLESKKLRKNMGKKGQKKAKSAYSIERVAELYKKLYGDFV